MNKYIKWTLTCVICSLLIIFFIPYHYYYHKQVHLSIDDVWECFDDLSKDSSSYSSVFEHPFFRELKIAHDLSGAKFTLYVYENVKDYSIDSIPQKYIRQLQGETDWLRVGFHASNDTIDRELIGDYSIFKKSFDVVNEKFVGGAKSLRLQYYYATSEEVSFLVNKGITTLLSADDDRISYSLPHSYNESLIGNESLLYKGMHYEHTDFRVENPLSPFKQLYSNRNDDTIVLFTHEWALQNRWNRYKLWFYLAFFSIYKSVFIID